MQAGVRTVDDRMCCAASCCLARASRDAVGPPSSEHRRRPGMYGMHIDYLQVQTLCLFHICHRSVTVAYVVQALIIVVKWCREAPLRLASPGGAGARISGAIGEPKSVCINYERRFWTRVVSAETSTRERETSDQRLVARAMCNTTSFYVNRPYRELQLYM